MWHEFRILSIFNRIVYIIVRQSNPINMRPPIKMFQNYRKKKNKFVNQFFFSLNFPIVIAIVMQLKHKIRWMRVNGKNLISFYVKVLNSIRFSDKPHGTRIRVVGRNLISSLNELYSKYESFVLLYHLTQCHAKKYHVQRFNTQKFASITNCFIFRFSSCHLCQPFKFMRIKINYSNWVLWMLDQINKISVAYTKDPSIVVCMVIAANIRNHAKKLLWFVSSFCCFGTTT